MMIYDIIFFFFQIKEHIDKNQINFKYNILYYPHI